MTKKEGWRFHIFFVVLFTFFIFVIFIIFFIFIVVILVVLIIVAFAFFVTTFVIAVRTSKSKNLFAISSFTYSKII